MKKKLTTTILIALIMCLSLSMLLLTACNKDGDKDKTPVDKTIVATNIMLDRIFANMENNIAFGDGKKFGVDIDVALNFKDKIDDANSAVFALTAKGNIDVKDGAKANDTGFAVELTRTVGETRTVILGVAYEEQIENGVYVPYLFVNLMGEYRKVNGFSLLALTAPENSASVSADSGIAGLIPLLGSILFGASGRQVDQTYTFNLDLGNIIQAVQDKLPMILGMLPEGVTIGTIDTVVAMIFGDETFKNASGETVKVDTLDNALLYVKTVYGSLKGNLVFDFDKTTKAFKSADITLNNNNLGMNLSASKLLLGKAASVENPYVEVEKSLNMSADERIAATALNLLNFQLNGVVTGTTADKVGDDGVVIKGSVLHTYEYSVNSDINPFGLLALMDKKNQNPEAISQIMKTLGYFDLTFKETTVPEPSVVADIFIHAEFDKNRVVVNVVTPKATVGLSLNVAIGGVYDIDALIGVIQELTATPAGADEGATAQAGIGDMIGGLLGALDFTNIKDGANIDVDKLATTLMTGLNMTDMIGAVKNVFGDSDFVNIKVSDTTFGTCEKVAEKDLVSSIMSLSTYKNKEFIKEITEGPDFVTEYEYGEKEVRYVNEKANEFTGKNHPIKGISLKDTVVDATGFLMCSNFDGTKVGAQHVTAYIGVDHNLASTLSIASMAGIFLDPSIPLFGALKYEFDVVVKADESKDPGTTVTTDLNDKIYFNANNNIARSFYSEIGATGKYLNLTINSATGTRFVKLVARTAVRLLDKNGVDVTSTVIVYLGSLTKSAYITVPGEYTLSVAVGAYKFEKQIYVDNVKYETPYVDAEPTEMFMGDEVKDYKIVETLFDGTIKELTPTATVYKIGSTKYTLEQLCDVKEVDGKNVYTIKYQNEFVGKVFTREYTFDMTNYGTAKKITTEGITIMLPLNKVHIAAEKSAPKCNQTIENYFKITFNNEVYYVKHNKVAGVDAWYAETAEGKKLDKDIVANFTLKDGAGKIVDVIFDANGIITNYNSVGAKPSSSVRTEVQYTISCDGMELASTFSFYSIYSPAKNINLSKNVNLDGSINVSYLYYEKNGEKIDLEFKFVGGRYAIVEKDTDNVVLEVTMSIKDKSNQTVTLDENGMFTAIGVYTINYSVNANGTVNTFSQTVTVKA